jgi:hypothetical protein
MLHDALFKLQMAWAMIRAAARDEQANLFENALWIIGILLAAAALFALFAAISGAFNKGAGFL